MSRHPLAQRFPRRATLRRLVAGDDGGSVTVFFAVAVVALLVLVGLVVDGGAKARALARADRLAGEAARAGGQAIDVPAALDGATPAVHVEAAARAARSYLSARGVSGIVTPTGDRRGLAVTVTVDEPTVFLGIVGVDAFTVRGHAEATLVRGVTEADS